MPGKPPVYIEKIVDLDESMQKIVNNLKPNKKVEKIAIKLNLCDFRLPETGAVSDPVVVESLLKALLGAYPSARIIMMENDATSVRADFMFRYLGFDKMAEKLSVEVANIAHSDWITRTVDGYRMKTVEVPSFLEDCDLVVTHPKLKTHSMTKLTCGLKNMFGCHRKKRKVTYHKFLDDAIVDINLAVRPNLSIVDANICHEGIGGPSYGFPKKVGLIMGSADVVALDAFCARLIGFNPWFVGHIRKAAAKGLGSMGCETFGDCKKTRFEFNKPLYYAMKVMRL
ncbi:MAG: DUF362 domain-containing protein [Candidatus Bathyarchaeia archaeon]